MIGIFRHPGHLLRISWCVNAFHSRNVISLRKLRRLYREFWYPSPDKPPFIHICQIGDPVLRRPAELVKPEDIKTKEIQDLINQMCYVMQDYGAVGLSAPQIGIPLQIFVTEFSAKAVKTFPPDVYKTREMCEYPLKIFINPKVKVLDYNKVRFAEACESIRGFSAEVARYREVVVSGLKEDGQPIRWQVSGWPARIVQHEMDHISGTLYTDIMERSSFVCTCWEKVNRTKGNICVPFSPQ